MSCAVDRGRLRSGPAPGRARSPRSSLSSRWLHGTARCISSSTSSRASASRARGRDPAVPARARSPARSPPATSRSTSTAPISPSCEHVPFLLVLLIVARSRWSCAGASPRRRSGSARGTLGAALAVAAIGARRAVLRRRAGRRSLRGVARPGSGASCARRSAIAATRPLLARVRGRPARRRRPRRAAALRRGQSRRCWRRCQSSAPPAGDRSRCAVPGVAAARRPPARGPEVRRAADPAVSPDRGDRPAKKLVLVVIDALKPAMLERAIANRACAGARGGSASEGVYVDDCVAAFPSVTPVCAATITTGVGPDDHLIPSMNWYHREEERYVEYGSSFSATPPVRRPAVADRHRLPDERRAPLARRRDRVRVARRRGRPHRRARRT